MQITAAAVALIAVLPAASLAQECVTGGFFLEFDGTCTPEAVIEAYEDQVFNAPGATSSSCNSSAEADLNAKLSNAGIADLTALCKKVYSSQDKVPFTDAAKRGTDLHFEQMFYNGRTDWQEEVETIHETEDGTVTSRLREDAEQVRAFFNGMAQGRRVEWPGSLTNFQSSVQDANSLATCTTNAAMCCWPKDRQANDGNGNCATPYDENCVDKDPADNTNLCYVDLERGNASTGFDSTDVLVYPGDNNQGEGAIHCHGLAWSNDVNDATARYKANNLFFVSMYDHMYQRGYVQNIPGAPMCGCVEQMPTVSRSDCTQVDLEESIEVTYDAVAKTFVTKIVSVHVDFNSCRGINNRNNDLWAYIAKLYYQGDITPKQFGEAGRIITNTNCHEATKYKLNQKSLTPGYDHDVSTWTNVAGRESMKLHDGYGHRAFTKSLVPNTDPANTHYGIIYRACQSCIRTHMKIFYRRRTPIPEDFSLIENILYRNNNGGGNNVWDVDFSLHSTYEDAMADTNPWLCPNNVFSYGDTFYGQCSPDGSRVRDQRSMFQYWNHKNDVAYFANKPEANGLQIISSDVIKGRSWASGIALQDPTDGTIYMTGAGNDIWWYRDDFNYHSQPADGDQTVIVHAGSISSPDPRSNSKSGIMFRTSKDSDSAHYSLFLAGSGSVCAQARLTTGSHARGYSCVAAESGQPVWTSAWLKVEKRMDVYTSFYGSQADVGGPITWTQVHSREIPTIGDSYNVGLAVCSVRSLSQEVVFKDYEVDQYFFPSAAPSISQSPTLFVPSQDIGNVGIAGSASQSATGTWTVKASGADIWGGSDQFHYVNFPMTGNVKVEMLVNGFDYVYPWQKGGIMIRESLATNSKHYSMFMSGSQGIAAMWRGVTGHSTYHKNNSNLKDKPVWLQVVKTGNVFTAAYKYDVAADWMPFFSDEIFTVTFDAESFFVGIAVTSHLNNQLATLEVGEFNIIDMPPTAPSARKLRGVQ